MHLQLLQVGPLGGERTKPDGSQQINRSSRLGKRLITLHALTTGGPVAERVKKVFPVSDLEWNGETPHQKPRTGLNNIIYF